MSLFRSEEMGLYTLRIAKDYAHEVMEALGWQAALHFIDANDKTKAKGNLPHMEIVKKCVEIHNIIEYLEGLCHKFHITLNDPTKSTVFVNDVRAGVLFKGKNSSAYFEETEQFLRDVNSFMRSQQEKSKEALNNHNKLLEQEVVIKALARNFANTKEDKKTSNIVKIAVVINKVDEIRFKRLIFRKSRGNAIVSAQDIFESTLKTLYIIVFRGEQLKQSIMAACGSFSRNV